MQDVSNCDEVESRGSNCTILVTIPHISPAVYYQNITRYQTICTPGSTETFYYKCPSFDDYTFTCPGNTHKTIVHHRCTYHEIPVCANYFSGSFFKSESENDN